MKTQRIITIRAALPVVATLLLTLHSNAAGFLLNADTPVTGSRLDTNPLITPFGTVTFVGEFQPANSDPEFIAAGAGGNAFDINNTSTAKLTFSFDVASITFIYGGNNGVIDVRARNINGDTIASFFQADTYSGQPAGPITLSGVGIRSLFWTDPGQGFAPLDNLQVTVVPEPSTSLLGLFVFISMLLHRQRNEARA